MNLNLFSYTSSKVPILCLKRSIYPDKVPVQSISARLRMGLAVEDAPANPDTFPAEKIINDELSIFDKSNLAAPKFKITL